MCSWKSNYKSAILLRILQGEKKILSNLSPKKCHVFILILESSFHTKSVFSFVFEFRWPVDEDCPTAVQRGAVPQSWSPLLFSHQAECSDPL